VYWSDLSLHQIEKAYLNGSERTVLREEEDNFHAYIGMAFHGDNIYWIDLAKPYGCLFALFNNL